MYPPLRNLVPLFCGELPLKKKSELNIWLVASCTHNLGTKTTTSKSREQSDVVAHACNSITQEICMRIALRQVLVIE